MGSFDYTCALSELGIGAGDEVFLIALAPSNQGLNGGAFSQFEIAFPPVRARYNDYGFVDDIQNTPFHEAFARKMGHPSADAFWQALSEGSVTVPGFHEERRAEFCLARVDAWNAMLSMPSAWWGSGSPQDAHALLAPGAREGAIILARAPEIMAKLDLAPIAARMAKGEYDNDRLAMMLMNTHLLDGVDDKGAFSVMFASRLLHSYSGSNLFAGASTLTVLALEMPKLGAGVDDLEQALRLYGETLVVGLAMNSVRKVWLARDSSGPQCGERALHWLWARKLGALADKAIDWNEEDCGLEGFAEAKALRERDAIAQSSAGATAKPKRSNL